VGVKLAPTAPSRGEPFLTADGWSIRFTRFALSVYVGASAGRGDSVTSLGSGARLLVPGNVEVDAIVRAIPVQPVTATIDYLPKSLRACDYCDFPYDTDRSDEAIRRRFSAPVESTDADADPYATWAPSVWFVAEATRGNERIAFDLAATPSLVSRRNRSPAVAIVANDIVHTTLTIAAENLFRLPDGRLSFDDFAAADADRDGILTYTELLAAKEKRYTAYVFAASDALQGDEAERTPLPPLPDAEGETVADEEETDLYTLFEVRTSLVLSQPKPP